MPNPPKAQKYIEWARCPRCGANLLFFPEEWKPKYRKARFECRICRETFPADYIELRR